MLSTEAAQTQAAPIVFTPCSLQTGGDDGLAECANIDVPLDWSKPDGRRANLFVKRVRGTAAGPHKQVWLLQGGPGGAGDGFDRYVPSVTAVDPAFDVYVPDHRGTGRSTYLDCPAHMATGDLLGCGDELVKIWGKEALSTFSTTTAARDVGHVIERTRQPGEEVHVYGVSYGTFWAQRYLQVFPKQPTSVTLDSVCQTGLCSLYKFAYWTDHVAKKLMRECATDPFCAGKLGADPIARTTDAIAVVEAKTCAGTARLDTPTFRSVLGAFAGQFRLRPLVPAIVFRTLRCNQGDVAALKAFVDAIVGPAKPPAGNPAAAPPSLWSQALGFNVAFSEMAEDPPVSREELKAMMRDAVFATYSPEMHDVAESWPLYARDQYVGKYPTADVPVLLMNGTLDGQTPIEFFEAIAPHFQRANQKAVVLPRATHAVAMGGAPTTGTPSVQCGAELWNKFMASPRSTLDTSCVERVRKIGFDAAPAAATYFLGTPDLWDAPGAVTRSSAVAAAELDATIRQLIAADPVLNRALRRLR